ncbi:hypothetical protein MKX03_027232 [Papaver bracteatum]|nr:hypothetical protein MKX03_027232 [Papaver bracteatum]
MLRLPGSTFLVKGSILNRVAKVTTSREAYNRWTDSRRVGDCKNVLNECDAAIDAGAESSPQVLTLPDQWITPKSKMVISHKVLNVAFPGSDFSNKQIMPKNHD